MFFIRYILITIIVCIYPCYGMEKPCSSLDNFSCPQAQSIECLENDTFVVLKNNSIVLYNFFNQPIWQSYLDENEIILNNACESNKQLLAILSTNQFYKGQTLKIFDLKKKII